MSKITYYFKDVWPDVASFKTSLAANTNLTTTDALHEYLYNKLYNRYCNSNIIYMTKDAFERHFCERYENVFDEMKFRLSLIGKAYGVTDDDLQTLSTMINAIANNSDTALSDPLDALAEYVSTQTGSKQKGNIFEAYINALEKIKDRYLIDFLRQFQSQFFWLSIDDNRYN